MPNDATPGGHYFALIASDSGKKTTSNINEIKRVASLVYLEVGGKLTKSAKLLSLQMPWFTTNSKLDVEFKLSNSGNTHIRGRLGVSLQRLPLGSSTEVTQADNLLLPASVRRFSQQLNLQHTPGLYKISVKYAPPQGGIMVISHYVLFVPAWLIVVIILVLAWLTWEGWRLLKHRRLAADKD